MKYWIWLQNALKYGNGRASSIIDAFDGVAKNIYDCDERILRNSGLFSEAELDALSDKDLEGAEETILYCLENEIKIIPYGSENYPNNLMNIPDPPIVLYVKGTLPDFNNTPSVCIVGPRKCSDFGVKAAYSLSARLSRGGMIVVSGGAKGIDTAAHRGALVERKPTVAFLAHGFGFDYLKENEPLRNEISECGCLITEFPPEYPLKNGAFHIRNRLMSALTLGTVVIEAGNRSGALITARCACEQGKDVFVIPGNPSAPQYVGSNLLLRDGAIPLLSALNVFDEYIGLYNDKLDIDKAMSQPLVPFAVAFGIKTERVTKEPVVVKKADISGVSAIAKAVYDSAPDEAFCVDELSVFNNYNAAELMTAVAELELFGHIKAVPGGRYVRIN